MDLTFKVGDFVAVLLKDETIIKGIITKITPEDIELDNDIIIKKYNIDKMKPEFWITEEDNEEK